MSMVSWVADHEPDMTVPAAVDEPVRPAGTVGPGDHLDLGRINWELGERVEQHGDVIGGCRGPSVAGTEQPGERFAGRVEIGEQRVKAEPALVRRCRLLLHGVRADQRCFEIEHREPGIGTRRLRPGRERRPALS